jgi:hypothetical protein
VSQQQHLSLQLHDLRFHYPQLLPSSLLLRCSQQCRLSSRHDNYVLNSLPPYGPQQNELDVNLVPAAVRLPCSKPCLLSSPS